jgi:ribosomal protein S18 acetylase RimI-like enzyme
MNLRKKIVILSIFGVTLFLTGVILKIQLCTKKVANNIQIREYKNEDQEEFMRILNDNWFWMIQGESKQDDTNYRKQLDTKKTCGYENETLNARMITVNDNIAGFSTFHNYDEKIARIQFLCIDKKFRRMHLAEKLIKSVIKEIFQNKNIEMIMLTTRSENTRAQNLYKKLGFDEVPTHGTELESDGTVILVLRKN